MEPTKPPSFFLSSDLQRLVDDAREDAGVDALDAARLTQVRARLQVAIAAPAPPRPGLGGGSWPLWGLGAVLTVGALAFALSRGARRAVEAPQAPTAVSAERARRTSPALEDAPPPAPPDVSPAPTERPASRGPLAPVALSPPLHVGVPTPFAVKRAPHPASTAESPPAVSPQRDPIVEEHDLLAQARRSLDANPGESLVLVTEHARRFPDGALTSERELLRILALARLGRTAEARAARSAFVARWPTSAYQGEIDRVLAP